MTKKYINIPKVCPVCGGELAIKMENESKMLMCKNSNCSGKLINKLDHFCGKKGLDIKGLSQATLEKLLDWGWISNISDIMTLEKYKIEWAKKQGFGLKSVEKILNSIESAKQTTLDKFISSLGIPLIGNNVAKVLTKNFTTYEELRDKINNNYDFSSIEGFADNKTASLLNFDYSEADKIFPYLSISAIQQEGGNDLQNLVVVITGKLNQFKNRSTLQKEIENRGGKVVNSISSNTSVLINNDATSNSTKNISAQKMGIPILTEQDFIKKFLK